MGKTTSLDKFDKLIKKVYFDLNSPAAFSGIEKVYREAKKHDKNVKLKDVVRYLQGERTFTLHKPARRRGFQNLQTAPANLNSHWQCDLCDFRKYKAKNDNYQYLLVCIDVLSRKIITAPTKTKSPKDLINAFEIIWKKANALPNKLYSDSGKEFTAKEMQTYFENKDILKYVMYSPHLHAGVVERANRTIKERLFKYMTHNNTERWIDIIDKIVDGINNSINRITGVTPNSVTYKNAQALIEKVYKDPNKIKYNKAKYKIGQIVRINKEKGDFYKGYLPNYTEELFRIKTVVTTTPIHYKLQDLDGEEILGVFYNEELSPTRIEPNARISEIIGERINRQGKKKYKVHWIGEPFSSNEWIKESENYALV